MHKNESKRKELYVNFDSEDSDSNVIDDMDTQINEYFALIKNGNFTNALDFWRVHQHTKNLQGLSKLAKKFLGVPASSAQVELMFSISGSVGDKTFRKISFFEVK